MVADGGDEQRSGSVPNRELAALLGPLFRPYLKHFAGAFLLLSLASGLTVLSPVLVKRALDRDIAQADLAGLRFTVWLYLGVQLTHVAASYLLRNWLEWTGQRMMAGLRQRIFDHLLELPLSFHDHYPPGRLLSRVESDTQALRVLFTTTGVMLLGDLLLFCGMFVAMAVFSFRLTLLVTALVPGLLFTTWWFQRRIRPLFLRVRTQGAALAGRVAEFLQALPVLRAYARARWATTELRALSREKFQLHFRGSRLIIVWWNLVMMHQTIAVGLILGIGGYWALGGALTAGTLVMFMGYVRRFFEPLLRVSEQLGQMQLALASSERILLLLREPVTIADPPDPRSWPGLCRGIEFDHVWFRYREDGPFVLKDVSFFLPAGECWALCGPTGSGKTTIIQLLLRFYDPTRGRVLIDGVDLRDLRQADLRAHSAQVLQDVYLFPGDLAFNLTLGQPRNEAEIEAAARATQAERFIRELPGGYHADLSERGHNLSVGQRQLLSFTRALVHDPQLLILDEATSAVDPATEIALVEATRRLIAGRTSVVVAHRLSTIRASHQILVLRQGEIIQRGRHDELVAQAGLYRSLHELQSREAGHAATSLG